MRSLMLKVTYARFSSFEYVLLAGKWVAKLVAHLLAMAALWVRIQTSLKIQNGRH
jgi:hypothetical protein